MMDIGKVLGVQSWTFRHFKKNEEVVKKIKECGLSAVELCPAHVNLAEAGSFAGVIKTYRDAGIEIVSMGVVRFSGDEKTERSYLEFAKAAGCKYLSVDFALEKMPGCVAIADRPAQEYGVKLAIHNHGGRHWLGSAAIIDRVFGKCGKQVGLCLDTAWAMDSGEDPVGLVQRFGERLYGLHIKDFTFDRARKPKDVPAGEGNLDLVKLYGALKQVNFGGFAVLEYEADVENPVPAVSKSVAAVREKMKG
jgi:inosose dehydratase